MESSKNIKIIYKENHDDITRVNESRVMSKGTEGEKERMISCFKDNIKGCETSKEYYGKKTLLQRNETKESSKKYR